MATFTKFKNPTDNGLNLCAATEQAAVLNSLYQVPPSVMIGQLQFLSPDATLKTSQETFPDWSLNLASTPRYFSWIDGTGVYCHVVGVYNAFQLVQALTGAVPQSPFPACSTAANANMYQMAGTIFASMDALNLFSPAVNVYLSGHSLGGAVVYYLGNLIKAKYPLCTVSVMTFAAPRTTTRACAASPAVDFVANVQTPGDFVTVLPPRLLTPIYPWQANGQIVVMNLDGTVGDPSANASADISPPWDYTKMIPHYMGTYTRALLAWWEENICVGDTRTILTGLGYVPMTTPDLQAPDVSQPVLPVDPAPPNWQQTTPPGVLPPLKLITGG